MIGKSSKPKKVKKMSKMLLPTKSITIQVFVAGKILSAIAQSLEMRISLD